jgi:ubiquinone/menaquinone biosynthesis C-methylase UbiE
MTQATSNKSRPADHWSGYWSRGPLTSLPEDFRANYDGEIAAFWHRCFADLPNPASILDVCTGNGALALLAAEFARAHQHEFRIRAVDAARIQPRLAAERDPALTGLVDRIEFIPETPLESFDCEPSSLNLVMSQYGIEYCDQAEAANRVARWVRPGGQFVMLCHALDSDMLSTMQREHREYQRLDELRLARVLGHWLDGQMSSPDLRARLQRIGRQLLPEYQRARSPLLGYALGVIQQLLQLDEAGLRARRSMVTDAQLQLRGGLDRLDDMLRVNRMMADPDWYRPYLDAGLVLDDDGPVLYQGQHHAGHYYRFHR